MPDHDCTCRKPRDPFGSGTCRYCGGFACPYASVGRARCPSWRCDCFVELYPDDPFGLHPEAFIVGQPPVDDER